MNNYVNILCGGIVLGATALFATPAAADLPPVAVAKEGFPLNFYIGTNWSGFYYNEPDIKVSHTGSYFPGLVARIDFDEPKSERLFASAEYKYLHGTYDYDGYVQTLGGAKHPYSNAALPQAKQTASALAGFYFGGPDNAVRFKLMAGAAYETTADNAYEVDRYFYKRSRNTLFGVIGVSARKMWEPYRSLEIGILAKPVISSSQTSRFADLGGIWATAPLVRQSEYGWGAEVFATYKYESLWFRPYVSYVALGATDWTHFTIGPNSEMAARAKEPANQTIEFGIDLGVWF